MICRSRVQEITMNLTVCIKCTQEKDKLSPKQAPNVVDNSIIMPSSPTGNEENTSKSPARKKSRSNTKTKMKSNKKDAEPTLPKIGELLAMPFG
jgi:BRCT domain type II-containing protein